MKRKNLLSAVLILFSFISAAQTDTVKYTEIINDPDNIPNFEIYIAPVNFGLSVKNLVSFGFGAGIRGTLENKFKLNTAYYRNILDFNNLMSGEAVNYNLEHPQNSNIILNQDFKSSFNFELGAGIIISDKTATKKGLINLAQQQTGYLIINTVTSVDTKIRKRTTLRAGYYQYQSLIDLISGFDSDKYILTENGDKLFDDGIEFSNINYSELEEASNREYSTYDAKLGITGWLTNMNVKSFFVGLETEYITNLVIETDKFGKRANQAITKLYGDAFFGKTTVSDFLFFSSNPSATNYGEETGTNIINYTARTGDNENEVNISKIGFRLGFERFGITPTKFTKWEDSDEISRKMNLGFKFEVGYLPGVKSNFFTNFGLMLIFNK